ncbi:response regulator [archaeon]|nr:MAG: response regulator [archaeon]
MTGSDVLATGFSSMLAQPIVKRHSHLIDQLSRLSCTQSNIIHTNYMLLSVIHRVEDYARLSRGQELTPILETVDVHAAIAEPIDCLAELEKAVQITFHPLPSNLSRYIITDKQWLKENLFCFVCNAVKYSDCGEVQVQVRLVSDGGLQLGQMESDNSQSEHSVKYLRIEVQDSGVITDDMMAQIFQPNAQQSRSSGGTGLGLFCLAKRIEALQGQFGVSRVTAGSVFWFQLPYREDPEAPAPLPDAKLFSNKFSTTVEDLYLANSTSTRVDDGHSLFLVPDNVLSDDDEVDPEGFKVEEVLSKSTTLMLPLNVLIVDDSMPIVKMMSLQMCNQGHTVSTAKHGAEAVQLIMDTAAADKTFDVVLMDLQMPIMDGCEATIRIRAWEQARQQSRSGVERPDDRLIIIGNTAFNHEEAIATALMAGMDCVLTKPLKIEEFYKAFQDIKVSR